MSKTAMKLLLRIFIFLFGVVIAGVVLLFILGWAASYALFDSEPQVAAYESTSLEDLRRIKHLAIDFSRQTSPDAVKRVTLSERDINLAIGHFVPRQAKLPEQTYFAAQLAPAERANVIASALAKPLAKQLYEQYRNQLQPWARSLAEKVVAASTGRWVNAQLELTVNADAEQGKWLSVEKIKLGSIPLNESLSRDIAARVLREITQREDMALAIESWKNLRRLSVEDTKLSVEFVIPERGGELALGGIESLVLKPGEQELINIYSRQLAALPRSGALVKVIAPLFEFAAQRSKQSRDPVAENRALLLALARRYGGEQLLTMMDSGQQRFARDIPKPYTIYGRRDLAQHLILSAGLSLIASQDVAELFGIDKELSDLLGGRSISAWDLLADKAGLRLAENATLSSASAIDTQKWFSRARRDRQILPDLGAEFDYSEDKFGPDELDQLELMIELYLEQHPALRKRS
ncbi:MAG: hypothetical protein KJP25_10100 [Gammaproteobacteria bacterium]|nr:hypothetical protein [Gammaproteobacteria bacterium]NNL10293.1 hypothetical protein [Pseudomonadales bacterium]